MLLMMMDVVDVVAYYPSIFITYVSTMTKNAQTKNSLRANVITD